MIVRECYITKSITLKDAGAYVNVCNMVDIFITFFSEIVFVGNNPTCLAYCPTVTSTPMELTFMETQAAILYGHCKLQENYFRDLS